MAIYRASMQRWLRGRGRIVRAPTYMGMSTRNDRPQPGARSGTKLYQ